jgi:hypothetical protein
MWLVAQAAIFADWRMFPQVWTTFFGVASVAGVVQCLAGERRGDRVSVRAVTSGAIHFPFKERVRKRIE